MKRFALPFLVASTLLGQGVKWETSMAEAQKRAKAEHKLIFMDVWTEWCSWCIKLQKNTFPAPEVQAALAKVVPLSLKTQLKDGTPTADDKFVKIYKVDGYPALFLLDADGKVVAQQPGYLPPAEFAAWLNGGIQDKR